MTKLYIAVLDNVPDHMVPVLVAHSVLNADAHFELLKDNELRNKYLDWKLISFKKCVVSVNQKQFNKLMFATDPKVRWIGHENTVNDGDASCIVYMPCTREEAPKVLQFAKLWGPKC